MIDADNTLLKSLLDVFKGLWMNLRGARVER
jgi:hypothetical protein